MPRSDVDQGDGHAAALVAWSADVRAALRRLEPTQRSLVQLVYFERRTQRQAAAELDMAPRAASRSLANAMQTLALIMLAQGGQTPA
ncbi:sigma factor-like helix-turn-helix DNA-binding protein [uncultured Jatrophihabitans sp.]|uniref:sigma factor-like helix-turn-helix DNA-binding protein n=1 Tax=uncultured Jatrophihabitans sp. TaxID=1610747 RepID=UPI0035CBEB9D